jgi:hypothetical protein
MCPPRLRPCTQLAPWPSARSSWPPLGLLFVIHQSIHQSSFISASLTSILLPPPPPHPSTLSGCDSICCAANHCPALRSPPPGLPKSRPHAPSAALALLKTGPLPAMFRVIGDISSSTSGPPSDAIATASDKLEELRRALSTRFSAFYNLHTSSTSESPAILAPNSDLGLCPGDLALDTTLREAS